MTPSESFVAELCSRSFLPFWSFSSPLQKKRKELCDILVVCNNDIIIISVKDINISDHQDERVQFERWQKKAVLSSIDQIFGAERFLDLASEITLNDSVTKVTLPPKELRNIYRIAIAFGGQGKFPLETGQYEKGFVHVFDEESTFAVFDELDTITDFLNYIRAKERFLAGKRIFVPKEVDFLALYIETSLEFEANPDTVIIDQNLWKNYSISEEYRDWHQKIKMSYVWDEIVSQLHEFRIIQNKELAKRADFERATRLITLEPRINRLELGITLIDAIEKRVRARMLKPLPGSNHTYVLMPLGEKNWIAKEKELQLRCMVARYENREAPEVVGIAIGKGPDGHNSFDIAYFNIPELTDEIITHIKLAKEELGYFKSPVVSHSKDIRGKY